MSRSDDHDGGVEPGANRPAVGYRHPPIEQRFTKGRSGNPAGRPKNRHLGVPHDAVLGQMVSVREGGRERRITAAEAFLLQLTCKGLAGDSAAARASLDAIEAARARRPVAYQPIKTIAIVPMIQATSTLLDTLGIATKKYPKDEARVRWELNPWIVEAALARLGKRRLTEDEQREVFANTRTPHKVRWPEWWVVRG